MCDPILVTLLKMQPHYSQSSRENATPSSGTSPVVSYKEVPPPPPGLKLHLTPKYIYIFCLNKSLHLFETNCTFLNKILTFYRQ